jgi:hypothetical protein
MPGRWLLRHWERWLCMLADRWDARGLRWGLLAVRLLLDREPDKGIDVLSAWSTCTHWVIRHLAGRELHRCWPYREGETAVLLERLARDPHIRVREGAASSVARLLARGGEREWACFSKWVTSPAPEVRQTAAMAMIPLLHEGITHISLREAAERLRSDPSDRVRTVIRFWPAG